MKIKILLTYIGIIYCSLALHAQSCNLQKFPLSDNIVKVKDGNYYGMYDKNDNVIVSVEYSDINFREDVALLTKSDNLFYGIVDMNGKAIYFSSPYRYDCNYPYFSEGYVPVCNNKRKGKQQWYYINKEGQYLLSPGSLFTPLTFNEAKPFSGGYAVVVDRKGVLRHVGKDCKEHYIMDDNQTVLYRTAVYEGDCVIITDSGIKVYQENESRQAIVKRNLVDRYAGLVIRECERQIICNVGVLQLDELWRAVNFTYSNGECVELRTSVTDSENLPTQITDPLVNIDDLKVYMEQGTVNADDDGFAKIRVVIENPFAEPIGPLAICVEAAGMRKEWTIDMLPGNSRHKSVNIKVPARMPEPEKRIPIRVAITGKNKSVVKKTSIRIKRYMPDW